MGCVSTELQTVSADQCSNNGSGRHSGAVGAGRWDFSDGKRVCKAYVTARPHVREQPRYIDLTIDGAGQQRVWF
ncbi:hypothetical protein HED51_24020 [Ochrobactrum grignonense]|nr:hypothetical protein [Brucella grignonensis]